MSKEVKRTASTASVVAVIAWLITMYSMWGEISALSTRYFALVTLFSIALAVFSVIIVTTTKIFLQKYL